MCDLTRHSKDASSAGLVDKFGSAPEGDAFKIRMSLKDGGVREIVFSRLTRVRLDDDDDPENDLFSLETAEGVVDVALHDIDCFWMGMSETELSQHPLQRPPTFQ